MRGARYWFGLLAGLSLVFACGTDTQYVQQPAAAAGKDAGTTPAGDDDTTADDDDTADAAPEQSGFPEHWIDGTKCKTDPDIQTWQHAPGFFILRQSLCTSFEGPFMYLIVGETKAMLVDTGDGNIELRPKVKELLTGKSLDLVVAHTHSHGDHVMGDTEFRGKSRTTLIGYQPKDVYEFFHIDASAMTAGSIDLGNRVIDVLPIPGHEAAHVAYFDRESKVLLTGDTLYPGRLYISDWAAYQKSVPRLLAFVEDGHTPSTILGGHIELRATPKDGEPDFPFQSVTHPNEHTLPLAIDDLKELDAVVKKEAADHGDTPENVVGKNFIFDPNP
jgi:glyoxylase-like metal-dependent hydrolase (beta-lactamase superfamily II)